MNAKLCKRLRREARKLAESQGWPERDMLHTNVHRVLYPWLRKTGLNGIVMDMGIRVVKTEVNNPKSARGAYLTMKRGLAARHG